LLASCAVAQTSSVSGALEGSVADTTGGRIPGVRVTVRDPATRRAREVPTNAEGGFHISELPPGQYEVVVSQPGFAAYRHAGVTVPLGVTVHLEIVLLSAAVTTAITVTAQPPAIDPEQTSVTATVDKERIEELPVESRNYLNFALLAPGVTASAQQPGRQSAAPLADSGFTFGGLRGRSNNVTIDGLDNNDEYIGASRTELSLETVQEFQVVNSGLSAETGGASGGSINVVTRVGSNQVHGDAFLFVQNGSLNARDPYETEAAPPMVHRYRAGAAMGGPIVRDRTFYYAGFEQEHNRALEDSYIDPGVVGAVNRVLAGGGFPQLATRRVSDGFFPTSRAETEASAKLNHQLTPRNAVMLRYAFTDNRESGDVYQAAWDDPSARGSSFIEDNALVGSLTSVFGPQSVGDLRFQFADRRAVMRSNDAAGPGVEIAGLIDFGRPYGGNGRRTERHAQAAYNYSHLIGRHDLKFGATMNRVSLDAAMADGFGGLYTFATLADFAAGHPDQFRRSYSAIGTNYVVASYGAFAQDHWRVTEKLTLDLGVRYDIERLPGMFRQDADNVSPRIGLAYHPAPAWVLRAGYGIFFDRYVLAALNRVVQKDGIHGYELVHDGAATALPIVPSIYTADRGLATPYSEQASFAVERLLARDLTASVSYLYVRGVKLSRTRNVGIGRDIFQLEDSAASTYHGASFTLNRRFANEVEFSAGYTLSKTRDNASDFDEQPQDPWDLRPEWALSRQHQQQRLVFNALFDLPIGEEEPGKPARTDLLTRIFGHIEMAPIFTAGSGRPVNPLTGVDTYRTDAFPLSARPPGFGRNSLTTPARATVDFRVLKYFPFGRMSRLDLVAEAFNLLNRGNVVSIDPVFGSPGFARPVAGSGARQLQFSLDYEF
jgi:hypothetical protein